MENLLNPERIKSVLINIWTYVRVMFSEWEREEEEGGEEVNSQIHTQLILKERAKNKNKSTRAVQVIKIDIECIFKYTHTH